MQITSASIIPKPSSHTCPQIPKTANILNVISNETDFRSSFIFRHFFGIIFKEFNLLWFSSSLSNLLTLDFNSSFVIVIWTSQPNLVIQIFYSANILVAPIVAIIFSIAHLALIYALLIFTNEHSFAVHAPVLHFVIIEFRAGFQLSCHSYITVAQKTNVFYSSEKSVKFVRSYSFFYFSIYNNLRIMVYLLMRKRSTNEIGLFASESTRLQWCVQPLFNVISL